MPPYRLESGARYAYQNVDAAPDRPKEERLKNYELVRHHLDGLDWELHPGAVPIYGDWPVETREEFAYAGASRLQSVRDACSSGRYHAFVLLGGGDPGYFEAREICQGHNIVCTANGHSQMIIASALGARFTVIDIAGPHNVYYRDLIYRYQMQDRCASIRHIGLRLPRPNADDLPQMTPERERAERGEPSVAVENAVRQAEAAILEDGAEVITLGCSGVYWLKPFLKSALVERGWDVGLARALAVDHTTERIRANSLSPGPIETARYVRKFDSLESARASGETLLARLWTGTIDPCTCKSAKAALLTSVKNHSIRVV